MCSNTRHATTASNDASANGSSAASDRAYTAPPPRSCATVIWFHVGSTPTTRRARGGEQPADLAVAAADVEHAIRTGELGGGQRQDLLDVLGVGTVGEPLDPPVGVRLPQVVIRVAFGSRGRWARGQRLRSAVMKFSIWPNPERTPAEVLDLARMADTEGWHCLWYADHYMPNTGGEDVLPGDVHECWAMLPAIAAVTERLRIGSLVAPTSVHHPAVLANRAATIDHISNGRMVLGIGAGWQINEHQAYGIELEEPATRVSRFEEAIQIIRSLLERGSHRLPRRLLRHHRRSGEPQAGAVAAADPRRHRQPADARASPPRTPTNGTRGAPPRWPAARSPSSTSPASRCRRDPATLWKSTQALVFMSDDADLAANIKAGDMGPRSIIGSNAQLVDEIGRYVELGFDELIIPDFTLGATFQERLDRYAELHAEVLSTFS